VFDFHFVSDVIYINFKSILKNNITTTNTIVIHLVARQFVTFRLLNLPSDLSIVILLNGESSIDFIDKNIQNEIDNNNKIQIKHSPSYDSNVKLNKNNRNIHREEALNNEKKDININQIERSNWIEYLKENLLFNKNDIYNEHLTKYCRIDHLFIETEEILKIITNKNDEHHSKRNLSSHDHVQFLELHQIVHDTDLILKKCETIIDEDELNSHELELMSIEDKISEFKIQNSKTVNINSNNTFKSAEDLKKYRLNFISSHFKDKNIYFLDIYDDNDTLDNINKIFRVFVRECNRNKGILLIIYVRGENINKQNIIIDDFNCKFDIYSNVPVKDIATDQIYYDFRQFEIDELNKFPSSSTTLFTDHLREQIIKIFSLKVFYYLKISSEVDEIEIRFLNQNEKYQMASNIIFNHLKQNIFIEKDFTYQNNKESSTVSYNHDRLSLKLILLEKSMLVSSKN
jgi:hypothetical protein